MGAGKRVIALAACAATALALGFPAAASAAQMQAAGTDMSAQAAKTATVYVVTQVKGKPAYDGAAWATTDTYAYNKNGLVSKAKTSYGKVTTYKYSGTKVKSSHCDYGVGISAAEGDANVGDAKYTYGKNGKRSTRKEARTIVQNGHTTKSTNTQKYAYDKKGRVVKVEDKDSNSKWPTMRYFLEFDKSGNPTSYIMTWLGESKSQGVKRTMKYSKHGDCTDTGMPPIKYKLTYDKAGKLAQKKTQGVDGYTGYTKYVYKKMTVPASAVAAVNEQQHFIKNPDYGNTLIVL